MINQNDNEKYFAMQDSDSVASECLQRASSFYKTLSMNYYLDSLVKMWLFYHGQYNVNFYGEAHRISFQGEQGELVGLPVNHFRNIAKHIINMITSNRPTMEARAVNTDYKSLAQTYLANSILDYYMREKRLEDCITRATEMAVVLGSGFIRLEWNATSGELYDFDPETGEKNYEGEIEFSTLSPFDVVFDGTKETWDHQWLLVRSYKNRFDLMTKYPELAEKIKGLPSKSDNSIYRLSLFTNDKTDDIPVYEFFHEKTESMPEGRYMLFVSPDIVLLDLPLPYRQIPVFRLTGGEYMGTPYGYSPMADIYPLQEAANSLYSTILTNQSAFGVQNLFVPRGADLDINSLEGALNILEGNAKPDTRGNPEKSLTSGTALALVQSMSLQFITSLQQNYVKFIEDVGSSLINILKDFAKTPKTMALVGKNNRPLLEAFTGDKIHSINRVIVSVGNPLARTTAGRVQMAEQMLQMGLIKNPKEYFQVINTGSIETAFEGDMNDLLLIKKENEFLMSGKPVVADLLDIHAMHIMEHRTVLADPDLRMNPELRAVVQEHIQQHIDYLRNADPDLLMLTGQQPLQPPPPPPGMAPPPGGPQGGPMPPPPGPGMDQMMQQPNGMPPNPREMIKGQGVAGGENLPQPAKPPGQFKQMPTNPQDMLPQG